MAEKARLLCAEGVHPCLPPPVSGVCHAHPCLTTDPLAFLPLRCPPPRAAQGMLSFSGVDETSAVGPPYVHRYLLAIDCPFPVLAFALLVWVSENLEGGANRKILKPSSPDGGYGFGDSGSSFCHPTRGFAHW